MKKFFASVVDGKFKPQSGLLIQRKKSELGVKRNLFEKAPAYQRGRILRIKSANTVRRNEPVNFECIYSYVISATVN